jgi:hypothetical protein
MGCWATHPILIEHPLSILGLWAPADGCNCCCFPTWATVGSCWNFSHHHCHHRSFVLLLCQPIGFLLTHWLWMTRRHKLFVRNSSLWGFPLVLRRIEIEYQLNIVQTFLCWLCLKWRPLDSWNCFFFGGGLNFEQRLDQAPPALSGAFLIVLFYHHLHSLSHAFYARSISTTKRLLGLFMLERAMMCHGCFQRGVFPWMSQNNVEPCWLWNIYREWQYLWPFASDLNMHLDMSMIAKSIKTRSAGHSSDYTLAILNGEKRHNMAEYLLLS